MAKLTKHQIELDAAISNYEARLRRAVEQAADEPTMPGVSIISGLRNDLTALLVMRREEDKDADTKRRISAVDAER